MLVHASAACEFGPFPYRATGIVCRMTKPAALLCKCLLMGLRFPPLHQEKLVIDQPSEGVSCFPGSRGNCFSSKLY